MSLLDGKTTLVTGAGGGVGKGIAKAMAAHGANVVVATRRLETGEPTAQEIRDAGGEAVATRCDVARRDDIDAAVSTAAQQYGGLDCIVHNALAKVGDGRQAEDWTPEHWDDMRSTAIRATFDCARAAKPLLDQQEGSSYIIISSAAGIEGSGYHPVYSMVKAAQRGFAKSLAREWAPEGIRVNCIGPVAVTESLEHTFSSHPDLADRLVARTPLGRLGDPTDDIGPVAVFLASELARFVTGQTVIVDGGGFTAL